MFKNILKKLVLLFALFLTLECVAQNHVNLLPLKLKGDLSKRYSYQFSTLIVKDDSIMLIAEKCGKIFILSKHNLDIISIKNDLPVNRISSIEGAAIFKNRYLFLLDEGKASVYCYDLQGQMPLKKIADKELLGSDHIGFLEGITINEDLSICYIMQEKTGKIMLFDIQEDFNLKRRTSISEINLPAKGWTRYTDMHFEKDKLYVLTTDYPSSTTVKYGFDVYSIDSSGTKLNNEYSRIDLTSFRGLGSITNYSKNLEGFAKQGSTFYVISDNHQSEMAGCQKCHATDPNCKITLLFKFKEPL